MTADLTPLVERQKALRRQVFRTTMAPVLVISGAAVVAFFGVTWWSAVLAAIMWSAGLGIFRWRKDPMAHPMARLELDQTTASLGTQRAMLRTSVDRRDAAQGLAMSDEAVGGDLPIGQDGELSKDR